MTPNILKEQPFLNKKAIFLLAGALVLMLGLTPLLDAAALKQVDVEELRFDLSKMELYVYYNDITGKFFFDVRTARANFVPDSNVSMVREIVTLKNELLKMGASPKLDEPVLYSTIGLFAALRHARSATVDMSKLAWLESQMVRPAGIRKHTLLKPVTAVQLLRAFHQKGLTMQQYISLVRKAREDCPNWRSPEAVYERIKKDFPGLTDVQISDHFNSIVRLYKRVLRHKLLGLVNETVQPDGIKNIYYEMCPDEKLLAVLYPGYALCVKDAWDEVYPLTETRFGPAQTDTREDAFRHPLWNVLIAECISWDPDVWYKDVAAWYAEGFTTAHESCWIDKPEYREGSKMDMHNNKEGLNYFESVAENKKSCFLWIFCTYYVEVPPLEDMMDGLHQKALDAVCVHNIDNYTVDQLRSNWGGNCIYFEAANGFRCNLSPYMSFNQYNYVFAYQRGNTSAPATRSVHLSSTPSKVLLSGTGHNQDKEGYARVMRVEVNGTVYKVISWLNLEDTLNFTDISSYAFRSGWNTVKAYIHWSNSTYDNGHWVTLKIKPLY